MYTLGGGIDAERGWGRTDETWHAKEELAAYGVEPTWFGLGDRDLATHLVRTQMLDAGYPLERGHRGAVPALAARASTAAADDRRPGRDARRRSTTREPAGAAGRALPGVLGPPARRGARARRRAGRRSSEATPGARRARGDRRRRRRARPAVQPGRLGRHDPRRARDPRGAAPTTAPRSSGVSPIVGGDHVRGMAAQLLDRDRRRGQRGRRGRALRRPQRAAGCSTAGWSTPPTRGSSSASRPPGSRCRAVPLMMTDHDATAAMARGGARPGRGGPR